jgi:Sel1 repeat
MEEIEQLRNEVKQRNAELKQRRDQSTMEIRRATQSALHRLAELEELQRIDDVKRNAVESGLVVSPVDSRIGNCLLCLDDLTLASESGPMFCCGAKICLKCTDKVRIHQDEAYEKLTKATSSCDKREAKTEYVKSYRCPSCRALRDKLDAEIASLARNAEAGRAWAQLQMGLMTMEGDGNFEKDRVKAAEWFSLAADQGSAMAMSMLCVL